MFGLWHSFLFSLTDLHTLSSIIMYALLTLVPYLIIEILMIPKFGGDLGKLLCKVYVKDANTLQNASLKQVIIRSLCKRVFFTMVIFLTLYISVWLATLLFVVSILALIDKKQQTFYDKIAGTVVISASD
ncbi:RDD family protein [Wolbachia endosymbiont of Pentidionis agamae]|uniref:RDD family protein n=1 Tax=Wolbachia endosymbiont of Pentidionis agamae TaxID=3110435 RepID=UPI002FD59900